MEREQVDEAFLVRVVDLVLFGAIPRRGRTAAEIPPPAKAKAHARRPARRG
jgi:hypothetical protein